MIGVATFVHGWYVDYIPLFAHAVKRAYPDYGVKVFLQGDLPERIRRNSDCQFVERRFPLQEVADPSKKPYYKRWLLTEDDLGEFEAVFICDVDLLMLPEDVPMHEQRLAVCGRISQPYANFLRAPVEGYPDRLSGWHFVKVREYFERMRSVIDRIENDPSFDISNPPSYCYDNGLGEKQWGQEALLCEMVRAAFGLDRDVVGEDVNRFPYHHGLHMGPFRGDLPERVQRQDTAALQHIGRNIVYWEMRDKLQDLLRNSRKLIQDIREPKVQHVVSRVVERYDVRRMFL